MKAWSVRRHSFSVWHSQGFFLGERSDAAYLSGVPKPYANRFSKWTDRPRDERRRLSTDGTFRGTSSGLLQDALRQWHPSKSVAGLQTHGPCIEVAIRDDGIYHDWVYVVYSQVLPFTIAIMSKPYYLCSFQHKIRPVPSLYTYLLSSLV